MSTVFLSAVWVHHPRYKEDNAVGGRKCKDGSLIHLPAVANPEQDREALKWGEALGPFVVFGTLALQFGSG